MCVAIAGRVAQELMLGPEGVTVVGVEDNSVLTDMCHELVTDSGWTSAFGVRTVGYRWGGGFAGGGSVHHRDYSRETADEIENLTLRAATYIHQHVAGILEANSGILKAAVAHLAEHQVLYSHELHAIMDREGPAVLPRPLVSPVGRRGDTGVLEPDGRPSATSKYGHAGEKQLKEMLDKAIASVNARREMERQMAKDL